jgi:hypothetical protein
VDQILPNFDPSPPQVGKCEHFTLYPIFVT